MNDDAWYPIPTLDDVLNDGSGRIVLALDFDGVVNASRPRWSDKPRRKWVQNSEGEFLVSWSPELCRELRALSKHPRVQVVWLTSWGSEIGTAEDALSLPVFPRGIGTVLPRKDVLAIKHAAIAEIAATGRPYIWCDDELARDANEPGGTGPRLEIRPNAKHGLTPADMERIWAFVRDTIARGHVDATGEGSGS